MAIVIDLDEFETTIIDDDVDPSGVSVKAVLDKFLDGGERVLDDITGVPRLPSPPSSTVNDLLRFDSSIHVSDHIDTFPIHTALSAVITRKIHLRFPDSVVATTTALFSKETRDKNDLQ
ncbi:unnamed protein product [Lupinus luteus]|uniref:Uncharacterized protein n=1 Tax=Lupinus luteus TaxID=3873 RepID=A0AAV1VXL0_LUPLU